MDSLGLTSNDYRKIGGTVIYIAGISLCVYAGLWVLAGANIIYDDVISNHHQKSKNVTDSLSNSESDESGNN